MTKKYLTLSEAYLSRFQRGGFLVGDVFKFNDNFKSAEQYKKLGQNVKDMIDQMIDTGFNMRVVGIKDTTSPRYPGNPQTSSSDVELTLALDNGGGRYTHYINISPELGQPLDIYPNLPPIPDAARRKDKVNIKPEEYVEDEENPSNKAERKLATKNTVLKHSKGPVQQNYAKSLKESINNNIMNSPKKDMDMLVEAYEQVLEEGFLDRLKARGAQAVGAVKGAGQQIAGGAKQLAGQAVSKVGDYAQKGVEAVGGTIDANQNKLSQYGKQLQKTGEKQSGAGQRAGEEAKYRSYISNTVKSLINDLNKLNMPVNDEATLSKELTDIIVKNLKNTTAKGQYKPAGGTFGAKVI